MPVSATSMQYILVCTCEITHFVIAIAIRNQTAPTLLEALFQHVFTLFGIPKTIILDKGAAFTSNLTCLSMLLKVQLYYVNPYNHGANRTERYIQSFRNILHTILSDTGNNWPTFLSAATYAMNSFTSPLTGYSPYEMVFIIEAQSPNALTTDLDSSVLTLEAQMHMKLQQRRISLIRKTMNAYQLRAQKKQLCRQMLKTVHTYTKGDWVMIHRPFKSTLLTDSKKLNRPWIGPLRVQTCADTDNYFLSNWQGLIVPLLVNQREMKPYSLQLVNKNHNWITL